MSVPATTQFSTPLREVVHAEGWAALSLVAGVCWWVTGRPVTAPVLWGVSSLTIVAVAAAGAGRHLRAWAVGTPTRRRSPSELALLVLGGVCAAAALMVPITVAQLIALGVSRTHGPLSTVPGQLDHVLLWSLLRPRVFIFLFIAAGAGTLRAMVRDQQNTAVVAAAEAILREGNRDAH